MFVNKKEIEKKKNKYKNTKKKDVKWWDIAMNNT